MEKKLLALIVILSFLASLLISRAIFFQPNQKSPTTVAPTTPAAEPTEPAEEKNERGNPQTEEEMTKQLAEDYPLFYKTPKREENWAAFYTDELELTIQYLDSADLSAVKEEVFQWVEKEGVDPDTHTLQWQEVSASAVPEE